MSSPINWEVARGRAEELRAAGLRPGADWRPRRRGLRLGARAQQVGEQLRHPLQRQSRGA